VEKVSRKARLSEWLESALGPLLSRVFSNQFPAVYMSFGAVQEMTTLCGYERLGGEHKEPGPEDALRTYREAERRHFAWYFNNAREQLNRSRSTRVLCEKDSRACLGSRTAPVSRRRPKSIGFSRFCFRRKHGADLVHKVDARIGTLPGMTGIRLMERYFENVV
jgi:hypothetical protein